MHTPNTSADQRGLEELRGELKASIEDLKKSGTTLEAIRKVAMAFVDYRIEDVRRTQKSDGRFQSSERNFLLLLEREGVPEEQRAAVLNMVANVLMKRLLESNQPNETAVDTGTEEVSSAIRDVIPEEWL